MGYNQPPSHRAFRRSQARVPEKNAPSPMHITPCDMSVRECHLAATQRTHITKDKLFFCLLAFAAPKTRPAFLFYSKCLFFQFKVQSSTPEPSRSCLPRAVKHQLISCRLLLLVASSPLCCLFWGFLGHLGMNTAPEHLSFGTYAPPGQCFSVSRNWQSS